MEVDHAEASSLLDELLAEAQGQTGQSDLRDAEVSQLSVLHHPSLNDDLVSAHHPSPTRHDGSLSPLSQQIADLCGELDSCLGNLDEWRKQGSRRVENLKRELEKEYGLSYKEPGGLASQDAWLLQDVDDEGNASTAAPASAHPGDGTPASSMLGGHQPSSAADAWEQAERHRLAVAAAAALASQEEARLQRLRNEVELLRRRSEEQESAQSADASFSGMVPEASGGTSAFNVLDGWVDEVDAILGPLSAREAPADSTVGELCLDDLERRLNEAQTDVLEAEHALDSARAHLAGQVGELETLMQECERLSDGMDMSEDPALPPGSRMMPE